MSPAHRRARTTREAFASASTASCMSPSGITATASNGQSMSTIKGKILRINPDGTIPNDNPFFTTATGQNRAIWALGLRNPYRFDVQPGTGKILINDVGNGSWEEINLGVAGANYGWNLTRARRPTHGSARRCSRIPIRLRTAPSPVAPSSAAPSTTRPPCASRRSTSGSTSSPTTARAGSACWIRRRPRRRTSRRRRAARRHAGRQRRCAVLPRPICRLGPAHHATARATLLPSITSHPSNVTVAVGPVGLLQRECGRHATAHFPVAARRRGHPGSDDGYVHVAIGRAVGQRRVVPGGRDERDRDGRRATAPR